MGNGFRDGLLYVEEKNKELKLCNFFPRVTNTSCYEKEGSTEYEVTLVLQYADGTMSKPICSNLNHLSHFDWEAFDIKANIFVSRTKAFSIFNKIIRVQIQNMDLQAVPYFDKLGWTTYKGESVYVAGNRIITATGLLNENKFHISPELQNLQFKFNSKVDESTACYYFLDLLKLNRNSLGLGMTLITSLMYSIFEEAGYTPCFTTYCVGKSQTKKTTLAQLICNIYNRHGSSGAGIMDLLSTAVALKKETQKYKDCCFILDDLHPSECKADMRHREERLSERIRVAGNHSERVTNQTSSLATKCLYIATAEYKLQSYSTNARCVLLNFDRPIDNKKLSRFQRNPETLCTFVLNFLCWVAKNKKEIVDYIKKNFKYNHFSKTGLSSRLAESELFLSTALDIFLDYMESATVDFDITKSEHIFLRRIHGILARQDSEMMRLRNANDPDAMFQVIVKAYYQKGFYAFKPDDINRVGCCVHKEHLYLDPQYALKLVQESLKNPSLTSKSLDKALCSIGVLSTDCSGKMTKKFKKKRMLVFPVEKFGSFNSFAGDGSLSPYEAFMNEHSNFNC
ncbi:MAG: hypothetical protein VB018_05515 [Lachnospiraceae bacterium]|nr:hypothetical protein [Lachnospiraceae bacterium]